jgi:hypothetical protein
MFIIILDGLIYCSCAQALKDKNVFIKKWIILENELSVLKMIPEEQL